MKSRNPSITPAQKSIVSEQDSSSRSVTGDHPILCCYTNRSRQIQIIRFKTSSTSNQQHIIFPGQRLLFEAIANSYLEIQLSETVTEHIPCQQLHVRVPSISAQRSALNFAS